jgi:PTS system beta-glucosides-specific IIC component
MNMAENDKSLAEEIVKNVGGEENVSSLVHCVTRLRFTLKDKSKADTEALKKLDGVMQVLDAGGQLQVVIGQRVADVYDAILENTHISGAGEVPADDEADNGKKENLWNRLLGTLSGCLQPTLYVLAAAGIIKGVTAFLASLGVLSTTSGTYMVLYAAGDGFFYFLPIMLGFTAARHFKSNEFIGASIGAALVYPSLVNIASTMEVAGTLFEGTSFAMSYYNTFLGIPIVLPGSGYPSSVIPIIIAVWVAAKLEKYFKAHLPQSINSIFTPIFSLGISVILTYLVIGPVSTLICGVIAYLITLLYEVPFIGRIIVGALVGGGFGVLVMFGLHWVVISIGLQTVALQGFDYLLAVAGIGPMVGIAQGLALVVRAKNRKVKNLAISGTISQICGVGEPLMYSILIPLKQPFTINIVSGCIGGAVVALLGTKLYQFGGSGLFGVTNYANAAGGTTDIIKFLIGTAVACVVCFIWQFMAYDDKKAAAVLDR